MSATAPPSIAVLLTCHNRVASTLRCLKEVYHQEHSELFRQKVFLVDAGSKDGTADRVAAEWPQATVIRRDASLYWNGGMRIAFASAIAEGFDYYLWLNDDTFLYRDAYARLLATARDTGDSSAIVVGAVRDPLSRAVSYGGCISASRWNRARVVRVGPTNAPRRCDTMNGNCVLIPCGVVDRIGNLDPCFTHGMGDMDYGFRANQAGCSVWIAPGFSGECAQNHGRGLWSDRSLPWIQRLRTMMGPKGLPVKEWFTFTRRHSGVLWPLCWLSPYLKMLLVGGLFISRIEPSREHDSYGQPGQQGYDGQSRHG